MMMQHNNKKANADSENRNNALQVRNCRGFSFQDSSLFQDLHHQWLFFLFFVESHMNKRVIPKKIGVNTKMVEILAWFLGIPILGNTHVYGRFPKMLIRNF